MSVSLLNIIRSYWQVLRIVVGCIEHLSLQANDFSKPSVGCHLGLWCQETEDSGVDNKSVWGPKTSEHNFHFDQIMGNTRHDGTLSFTNTCIRFDLSEIIGYWGAKWRTHRLIQQTAQFNALHCSAKTKVYLAQLATTRRTARWARWPWQTTFQRRSTRPTHKIRNWFNHETNHGLRR